MTDAGYGVLVRRLLEDGEAGFVKLAGDASNRSYFRATGPGGATVVLMKLADDPLKSEEVVDGERPVRMPFLDVADYLDRGGVPVPAILHEDLAVGVIVIEDLGDVTVERALAQGAPRMPLYEQAVTLLAQMQAYTTSQPDPDCVAFRRRFGEGLLRWEFEHFYEWGLVAWTGKTPTPAEREVLEAFFADVVARLVALPQGFVHRDFQSRNLMIKDGRLRLIDFQDALIGPYLYDLVALLRDSYVTFTPAEAAYIRRAYLEARRREGLSVDGEDDLAVAFQLQAMQRKLKDAGRFVYIDRVKHNPKFLGNIPQSLAYAREAIAAFPEFVDARTVLARYLPDAFGDPA